MTLLSRAPRQRTPAGADLARPLRPAPPVVLAWSAAAVALCAVGQGQLALVAAVAFAAMLVPAERGWAVRLFLGAGLVACWLVALGAVAGLLAVPLPPTLAAACAVVPFAALAAAAGEGDLRRTRDGDRGVAAVAAGLVLLSLPRMLGRPSDVVTRLTHAHDNGVHFWFLNGVAHGRGFAWSEQGLPGLLPGAVTYTQGEAFLSAYVPWILTGGTAAPGVSEAVLYAGVMYPVKVVVLAVAGLLVVRELAWGALTGPGARLGQVLSGGAVVLLLYAGLGSVLSEYGFQSQSLALAALLTGLLALMQRGPRPRLLLAGAAFLVLTSHSWLLVSPVLATAVALAALRDRRTVSWWAWTGLAATGLVSGLGVLRVLTHLEKGVVAAASAPGAVLGTPPLTFAALAVLGALSVGWLFRREGLARQARVLAEALAGAALVCLGVGVLLLAHGGLGYYFHKCVYLLVALLAVAASAGLGLLASGARSRQEPTRVAIAAALLVLAWLPLAPWVLFHVAMLEPPQVDERAVRLALRAGEGRATPPTDVLVLHACRHGAEVDYSSQWTGTLLRTWTADRVALVTAEQRDDGVLSDRERLALVAHYARSRSATTEVLVRPGCPFAGTLEGAGIPDLRVRTASR